MSNDINSGSASSNPGQITVTYVNNEGGGFLREVPIAAGTTIGTFIRTQVTNPSRNMIRVNREQVAETYVLQNGDRISVTPTKIEGANQITLTVVNNGATNPYQVRAGITLQEFLPLLGLPSGQVLTSNGQVANPGVAFYQDTTLVVAAAPSLINVVYVNNEGGGFADNVSIAQGTTIGQFLQGRRVSLQGNLIRVNRGEVTQDYVLQNGDRISVTPTKIEGACDNGSVCVQVVRRDLPAGCHPNLARTFALQVRNGISLPELLAILPGIPCNARFVVSTQPLEYPETAAWASAIHRFNCANNFLYILPACQPAVQQAQPVYGSIGISYLNRDGGGFATNITVYAGTSVGQLLAQQGINCPDQYKIRVNDEPVAANDVLRHGDRVTVTKLQVQAPILTATVRVTVNGRSIGCRNIAKHRTIENYVRGEFGDPNRRVIRVNGSQVSAYYTFQDGDELSIGPVGGF